MRANPDNVDRAPASSSPPTTSNGSRPGTNIAEDVVFLTGEIGDLSPHRPPSPRAAGSGRAARAMMTPMADQSTRLGLASCATPTPASGA
jgi:hypothetical protein